MNNKVAFLLFCTFFVFLISIKSALACCPPPPATGSCPSIPAGGGGDCVSQEYIDSLIGTESGGRYQCINCGNMEANGRYQFMDATRADVQARTGVPCAVSPGTFAHCPELQDACFQAFNRLNYDHMQSCGAMDAVGTTINGVEVTESCLLAVAHLGGAGGACNYVSTGGTYNPDDGATSLTDYCRTHGGLPAMGPDCPSTPPSGPPPPSASCSGGGSPMCTVTDVGTDVGQGADFDLPPIPDISEFLRCSDQCDNHATGTTPNSYYQYCPSIPTGCCCPGQILFGSINAGRECPCCFFSCDDDD